MLIRARAVRVLAAAVLAAGGLTAATSTQAIAATTAATSCYDSARYYTTSGDDTFWPAGSYWVYTTSNCDDINVKPNSGTKVRTCFDPTSGANYCNSWRWIAGGTWGLAATTVSNGTKFYLDFDRLSDGQVAY